MLSRQLLHFLVVLVLLSYHTFALNATDFFVNLKENKADITTGYARFTMHNPLGSNLMFSNGSLVPNFLSQNNIDILYYDLFYVEPAYTTTINKSIITNVICINASIPNNLSQKNCTYTYGWVLDNETTQEKLLSPYNRVYSAGSNWDIVLQAHYLPSTGFKAVDWIPSINVSGVLYSRDDWAWWNTSWQKVNCFNVKANSQNVTYYNISKNITYDSDMQNNFIDLRFVNDNTSTALDYYIDSKTDGAWADIRIEMDTINNQTNNTVCMYYKNQTVVANMSNATNTFLWWDDFNWDTEASYNYNYSYDGACANILNWHSAGEMNIYSSCPSGQNNFIGFNATSEYSSGFKLTTQIKKNTSTAIWGGGFVAYWLQDRSFQFIKSLDSTELYIRSQITSTGDLLDNSSSSMPMFTDYRYMNITGYSNNTHILYYNNNMSVIHYNNTISRLQKGIGFATWVEPVNYTVNFVHAYKRSTIEPTVYDFIGETSQYSWRNLSARTDPTGSINISATPVSLISGYCKANSSSASSFVFSYKWYLNDQTNSTGTYNYFSLLNSIVSNSTVSSSGSWTDLGNAKDNDFATYAVTADNSTNSTVTWNFTRPGNTNATIVYLKHGNLAPYNATLPTNCNKSVVELRAWSTTTNSSTGAVLSQGSWSARIRNASYGGTGNWTNQNASNISDGRYATSPASTTIGYKTNYLNLTDFDFNIPADATIVGVEFLVEARSSSGSRMWTDQAGYIVQNGAFVGTNTTNSTSWGNSDANYTIGKEDYLWGLTNLTPAVVNDAGFGYAISAMKVQSSLSSSSSIDGIYGTVYYMQGVSSSSGFECYDSSSWVAVGSVDSNSVNFSSGYIYDNWLLVNGTGNSTANNTEIIANNLTAGIVAGNWTFECAANDGSTTTYQNSSVLFLYGEGGAPPAGDTCTPPTAPDTSWTVRSEDYCNITGTVNLGLGRFLYNGSGIINFTACNLNASEFSRIDVTNTSVFTYIWVMQGSVLHFGGR